MQTFNSITEASSAVLDLAVSDLPEGARDPYRTVRTSMSPVDRIVGAGEIIYAWRADAPADARQLAASLISYATGFGFHGLADGRGDGVVKALLRDLGETPPAGTTWPEPADDPAALMQYAPPAATPEPTPTEAEPAQ